MSAFFAKKIAFLCPKNCLVRAVLGFLVLFSVFLRQKVTINENINFADSVSGIQPPDCSKLAKNPKNDDITIFWHDIIIHFFFLTFFFSFDFFLILLSSLVSGPSFMSISSLVLELWQFSFIRDWPEIRKWEIPPPEFCPISGNWDKLWIPNLTRISLIEY